jgi:hypothetical protein
MLCRAESAQQGCSALLCCGEATCVCTFCYVTVCVQGQGVRHAKGYGLVSNLMAPSLDLAC